MISYFAGIFLFLRSFFRSRFNLGLEIVALRHQLSVLHRKEDRPFIREFFVFLQDKSSSNILTK
jgi:hypothetical protein